MKDVKPAPKRHLGRGLSALLGGDEAVQAAAGVVTSGAPAAPREAESPAAARSAREVPIEKIHPGRFQPRRHFDKDELEALADSIRANGIVQPILVRPHSTFAGEFELIAGERRWRAAQLVPLHTVPVVERPLDDRAALEVSLIENIQRADLTPIEEAEGYQRLIDEFRNTQETLAQDLGKSRSHIANLLRLLTLPDHVKRMIDERKLTPGHARALVGRRDAIQLANRIVAEGLTVRQVEQIASYAGEGARVDTGKPGKPGANGALAAAYTKDVNTRALERDFSARLGLRVTIRDRGKKGGDFILHYDDLDQLDDILTKLSEPRPAR
jgi:ParB family chromosome partitioning protein